MDWIYGQIVGFLGNFFALMGNMGVELFELEWVSAIILFFSRLAWALFAVSVVVCAFECGIEYSTGRGNLQQCGMNIIKGFLAVSLFTVVPVRLYALSVSLQGTFSAGLTGYGRSIGEVGQDIITELNEIQSLSDVVNSSHFGLGIITSPIMLLFYVVLMGYAVLTVRYKISRGRYGRWRALVNASICDIAKAYKILPENLRWYAAFHQKPNQVHIHMILFSADPKEGYLTKEGIRQVKSVFARRIYHADRMHIYQQKDIARQELQTRTRRAMVGCVAQLGSGAVENLQLEQLTEELAERLLTVKGRKVYGYLPPRVKAIVDAIVEELAKDERVSAAYETWQTLYEQVCLDYDQRPPKRLPLSRQKEFKTVRN